MASYSINVKQDLAGSMERHILKTPLVRNNQYAHVFNVEVTNNGVPYPVGSVEANFVQSNGMTVPLDSTYCSSSGNVATVRLPQACYTVPGRAILVINCESDGGITCIAWFDCTVLNGSTENALDPGTIIPSVETLISRIDAAVDSIPADYSQLLASISSNFSTGTSYAAGAYVWGPDNASHPGALYRFTTAHSGTWAEADAVTVSIGNELNDTVRYTQQVHTDAEKAIARTNMGAAAAADLTALSNSVGTVPSGTTVENQIFSQGTQISTNASNIDAIQRQVGTVPTGETVEGQIGDLKSAIDDIESQQIDPKKLSDLVLHSGYIASDGSIASNINFVYTNLLNVSYTTSIVVNLIGSGENVSTIACYNSNKEYVSLDSKKESFSGEFSIPNGIAYIRLCTNINRKDYPCVILCKSTSADDAFSIIQNDTKRENEDIAAINTQKIIADHLNDLIFNAGYVGVDGTIISNAYYSHTNLLNVEDIESINVTLTGFNSNIAIIACYDDDMNFVAASSIIQASYSGEFSIPQNIKYIRLTTSNAALNSECSIVCKSTKIEDAFSTRDTVLYNDKNTLVEIGSLITTKEQYFEVPSNYRTIYTGGFMKTDGTISNNAAWQYEKVSVSSGEKYEVNAYAGVNAVLWLVLDSSNAVILNSQDTSALGEKHEFVTIPDNGTTLVVNEQANAQTYLNAISIKKGNIGKYVKEESVELGQETLAEYVQASNVLYGKTLCCCGDSITYGADLEDEGFTNSDIVNVYNWSGTGASGSWVQTTTGIRMTYGWHIARRNHMTFYNGGVSGSTMQGILDKSGFSLANGRYTQLPNDIDYLTIFFGWNDKRRNYGYNKRKLLWGV